MMGFLPREVFARRRASFFDEMEKHGPDAVAVFAAAPVAIRNNDVEHDYRQCSDFFYLTGFDEPHSVLVLSLPERKATLFVRPRDPEREIWDGPRAGIDGAIADFGMDDAKLMSDLSGNLANLLENKSRLYYRIGRDRHFDDVVLECLDRLRLRARRRGFFPTEIVDPSTIVHEQRLFKGVEEVAVMDRAAAITREAHCRAMSATKPGMAEFEIESILLETFRRHGADRTAYSSIVGSGPNATILHYRAGHRVMREGELLLIDAGCEYGYYASDVTRTFPVNGRFSREQQAIYEIVLDAELACIEAVHVGTTLDAIHDIAVESVVKGLIRVGILSGDVSKLIADEAYKPFFMHRTSHWLGMDVHDVGAYFTRTGPRALAPGMVLTIEPGVYIGRDEPRVAPEWRGIGVRIEDDILVTESGYRNLTEAIPKTVVDVEKACAG